MRSGLLPLLRERIGRFAGSSVLDLGPPSSGLLEYLGGSRCRVHYNTLRDALPARLQRGDLASCDLTTVVETLGSRNGGPRSFDVILAWDYLDYLAPEQLQPLVTGLTSQCRPGAWLYCQTYQGVAMPAQPARFQIDATVAGEVCFTTEPADAVRAPRRLPGNVLLGWMSGFSILKLHLMQDAKQEHLFCYDADQ